MVRTITIDRPLPGAWLHFVGKNVERTGNLSKVWFTYHFGTERSFQEALEMHDFTGILVKRFEGYRPAGVTVH